MQRFIQDLGDIFRGITMSFDFNRLLFSFLGIFVSIVWIVLLLTSFNSFGFVNVKLSHLTNNFLFTLHPNFSLLFANISDLLLGAGLGEYIALAILFLGLIAIWSLVGGVITRTVALEFARDEKFKLKETILFVLQKFWSYFWSPIIPVLGVLFFTACNIIGGLIGQIKYVGEVAIAVGFPLVIISTFLVLFIGIVGVIGFLLMFPTISAEGSDCFDAMSRSYSYVLARPKRYLSLLLSIIGCGAVWALFVNGLAYLIIQTTFFTMGLGMGQKLDSIRVLLSGSVDPTLLGRDGFVSLGTWSLKFFTVMLVIYLLLVKVVAGSFVVVFAGTASTISYFILRQDVDGTAIGDVYYEAIEEEINEAVLVDDKTGEDMTIEREV